MDKNLLAWIIKQPRWMRDALARHIKTPYFELGQEDKEEIVRRVKLEAGFVDDLECEFIEFASEHLTDSATSNARVVLASLSSVKNMARLASDQKLSFATNGITLIYGNNGTGKSGYCRIAKKLCRSPTSNVLLNDVFENGPKIPVELTVRYRLNDVEEVIEEVWKDGTSPPPAISNISVFDSENARFFVNKNNKIGFLPREVALLERFAGHCTEMAISFASEIKGQDARIKIPLPEGYSKDSAVAKILLRLTPEHDLPNEDELRAAAICSIDDQKDIEKLQLKLAQDPQAQAQRLRRLVSILKSYQPITEKIEEFLSSEITEKLKGLALASKSTADAAALAASQLFKLEPLPGIGLPAWRRMFDYAQDYALSIDQNRKLTSFDQGNRCLLCQQILDEEGSDRLRRFSDFVGDRATQEAEDAKNKLALEVNKISQISIPHNQDIQNALADYSTIGEETSSAPRLIIEYFENAKARLFGVVQAAVTSNFDGITLKVYSISAFLIKEILRLENNASSFDKMKDTPNEENKRDRILLFELLDRKKLSHDIETILERRSDLELADKLKRCRELVNTLQVSVQITSLRRTLVTAELQRQIADEIEALNLNHLPFEVSDHSAAGNSFYAIGLRTPVKVANDQVLSEGEQRALALACFLGELGTDTAQNGMIIDDPVDLAPAS